MRLHFSRMDSGLTPYDPFLQNPEDPTTYPAPMGDGQSSLTYTNPLSPLHGSRVQDQGRYAGIPEL